VQFLSEEPGASFVIVDEGRGLCTFRIV